MRRERLNVLLLHEVTQAPVFISIPGSFQAPEMVSRLLAESRSFPRDGKSLRRLGSVIRPLNGVRSLVPGQAVTHAVTALVSKDLEAELQAGQDKGSSHKTLLH